MSGTTKRLIIVGAASLAWGVVTILSRVMLEPLSAGFGAIVRVGIKLCGVSCVRDGFSLYLPTSSTSVSIADLGIYWWGIIASVWLTAKLNSQTEKFLKCGLSILLSVLLHTLYAVSSILALAAHMSKVGTLIHVVWYATVVFLTYGLIQWSAADSIESNSENPILTPRSTAQGTGLY